MRNDMAQKYNTSPSVDTGDLDPLHIDVKHCRLAALAKLFCKVIHKLQSDMHELQCLHRKLSSQHRTTDLERLPTTIDLQIGNNTTRVALTKRWH